METKFKLSINCDNDAFCVDSEPAPTSAAPEIARILRDVAVILERGELYSSETQLRDINGNIVGTFVLTKI